MTFAVFVHKRQKRLKFLNINVLENASSHEFIHLT